MAASLDFLYRGTPHKINFRVLIRMLGRNLVTVQMSFFMKHYYGHLGCKAGQIIRFLNGLVTGSQHIDFLSLEEFRVAGRTVGNPMPGKFPLALDIKFPGPGAQIQDDAARHEIPAPLCLHNERVVLFPDSCHGGALKFYRGMAGSVFPEQLHQVLPAVRFGSRIIPDFIRIINPSAITSLFQQQCPALGTSGIDSR